LSFIEGLGAELCWRGDGIFSLEQAEHEFISNFKTKKTKELRLNSKSQDYCIMYNDEYKNTYLPSYILYDDNDELLFNFWLHEIEGLATDDTNIDALLFLGDIYIFIDDLVKYENDNNISIIDNQDHQTKPITNQDDSYKYSEALKPQSYLDKDHPSYSSELAMCIELWNDLYINNYGNQSEGVKNRIKAWLKETQNKDLEEDNSYLKKITSIVNYDSNPHKKKKS
jgi:hypothetical protein